MKSITKYIIALIFSLSHYNGVMGRPINFLRNDLRQSVSLYTLPKESRSISESNDFFEADRLLLEVEDYGVWDHSMSLSMSLSMPLLSDFPSLTPSSVITKQKLPSDYPSFVPSDTPSILPSISPSLSPSSLPLSKSKIQSTMKTLMPSPSPTGKVIVKLEGEESDQANVNDSRLTPIGTGFITLTVVILAAAMGIVFLRWRAMRRIGGQSVDLTGQSSLPSVSDSSIGYSA